MPPVRPRAFLPLLVALIASAWSPLAEANLIFSFDAPSYSIANVGSSTTVGLYVSEVPGTLPNITAANPLLTGGVQLTFASSGAAIETGFTTSSAWDNSSFGSAISGSNTVLSLTVLSLFGIADLSKPLLLGSFTFTGESLGSTSVLASTIRPGVNFIDRNGDNLDPTNTPTALIRVGNSTTVPEPSSLPLAIIGAACGLLWFSDRRLLSPKDFLKSTFDR